MNAHVFNTLKVPHQRHLAETSLAYPMVPIHRSRRQSIRSRATLTNACPASLRHIDEPTSTDASAIQQLSDRTDPRTNPYAVHSMGVRSARWPNAANSIRMLYCKHVRASRRCAATPILRFVSPRRVLGGVSL